MKGTDQFKKTIQNYLEDRAKKDELFAKSYSKPNKNIDACITYVLNTVKNSGCNGYADEEIYGMALHYYDEDGIEPGRPISGTVVVNHHIELTDEEKNQAKDKAKKEFEELQRKELRQAEERKEAIEKKKMERLKKAEAKKLVKQEELIKSMEPTLF